MLQRLLLARAAVCNCEILKTVFPDEHFESFYMFSAKASVPAEEALSGTLLTK